MISSNELDRVEGATAYGSDGDKIGKVGQIYLDDQTNEPSWVTVNTGLFGTSQSFVPLEGASFDGSDLRLGYSKDKIKDAPRVDADQHLDRDEEDQLYRYYGLGSGSAGYADSGYSETTTGTSGTVGTAGAAGAAGTTGLTDTDYETTGTAGTHATAGTEFEAAGTTGTAGYAETAGTARDEEASAVLHEERLQVGTESREAGRVRLRKYTTSDTQTVSVPVTKEKVVVERTPVEGEAVTSAPIGESDQVEEITLREERAVVGKETVAVEEVAIGKEAVTETEQVSGEVRREHVDVDVDGDVSGTGLTDDETGRGGLGR